ncbi:MAG: hypothetical protein R3B99_14715 [Polyangiales bacterium]|nr:hypothetical protein [Myxococcales bacterium]MCB9603877.1 hypothetical protein [Sandaracinus sp.]
MRDVVLDPPESLLGQLQRGLGRGYLACVRDKRADALLHGIHSDPRWDRQGEERAAYYAKLALALRVDVTPMANAVQEGDVRDGRGALAADVLLEMAVRGRDDALDALRAALRHDGWSLALLALDEAEPRYGRRLLERFVWWRLGRRWSSKPSPLTRRCPGDDGPRRCQSFVRSTGTRRLAPKRRSRTPR